MRLSLIFLALVAMFAFSACSNAPENGEEAKEDQNEKVNLPPAEVGPESDDEFDLNLDNAMGELDLY